MASLANQTISSSYDGLVKTATDQPVGVSGVQLLEDGVGNSLALSVGRANQGVTVTGTLTATTVTGTLSATSVLANGVIATTQATSDNSTKVATTAYVKSVVTAEDLDIAGTTGTGSVDLDSQVLTIAGTANEIETSASGQTITIGLPSTITANVTGNVSGNLTGTVLTAAQANITSVGTLSSLAVSGNLTVDTNTLFVDAANDNVGIGTSPSTKLHIAGDAATLTLSDTTASTSSTSTVLFKNRDGNNNLQDIAKIKAITGGNGGSGNISFETALFGTMSEKMRITREGDVLIGLTSLQDPKSEAGNGFGFDPSGYFFSSRTSSNVMNVRRQGTDGDIINFWKGLQENDVGSISVTDSATAYNTSSDYRLKENVVPMEGALDRVSQLQPSRFNFISTPELTVDGFLAHQVQEVVPEAITGKKDEVDEKGKPIYQKIDQSKIVPLLVGAIQELKAEIETLKAQING